MSFLVKTRRRKIASITLLSVLLFGGFVITFAGKTPDVVGSQISGFFINNGVKTEITIQVTHTQSVANLGWLLNQWFRGQFWTPSCWVNCSKITYTLDPTVHVVNNGFDFEQCKTFGSAGTIVCTAADTAQFMSVSSSSTVTDTDSACPATVQITNGFSIIAGTITAGAAGNPTTTTETHTWTATAAVGPVGLACIQTEGSGGGNIVLYSEGQFGPDTLANGDTLKITWSIARSHA